MPKRIQLSRKKGWRLPEGAVNVARPTKWGNPFTVHESGCAFLAVRYFRRWLRGLHLVGEMEERRAAVIEGLPSLRGKDLACWCPLPGPGQPDHCHASVLISLANDKETSP